MCCWSCVAGRVLLVMCCWSCVAGHSGRHPWSSSPQPRFRSESVDRKLDPFMDPSWAGHPGLSSRAFDVFGTRVTLDGSGLGPSMLTRSGFAAGPRCLYGLFSMFSLQVRGEHRQKAQPPLGEQRGTPWSPLRGRRGSGGHRAVATVPGLGFVAGVDSSRASRGDRVRDHRAPCADLPCCYPKRPPRDEFVSARSLFESGGPGGGPVRDLVGIGWWPGSSAPSSQFCSPVPRCTGSAIPPENSPDRTGSGRRLARAENPTPET
jgi:hypothetical protein